ncbi:MAG: acyltransferase [Clostridia bacterium]|nr:acyltransferase [Clostridia bacterium]
MHNLFLKAADVLSNALLQVHQAAKEYEEIQKAGETAEELVLPVKLQIVQSTYKLFRELKAFDQVYRYNTYRKQYDIAPTFRFVAEETYLYGDGKISLGANSYIGRYSSIQAVEGCRVEIGKNCRISHFVKIYTMNTEADQDFSAPELVKRKGDVIIGDYCWIGAGALIREGVTIGDNCVIGANSVVTQDVPSYSIVAGNPAKIVKKKSCAPNA